MTRQGLRQDMKLFSGREIGNTDPEFLLCWHYYQKGKREGHKEGSKAGYKQGYEKLEKELKFKDEMIAAMNIHGPALEQEIKELKIEIIKLKAEIKFITE